MNLKRIMIYAFILLILSMTAVSSADFDDNSTDGLNDNSLESFEIQDSQNLANPEGTFSDLQSLIDNTPEYGAILLNQDYSQGKAVHIDKSITIDGQGHTIDGQNIHNLITSAKGIITFKNINFKNGYIEDRIGGAIYSKGTSDITIINCTFVNNQAYQGGAIYNAGRSLMVINCTFKKNSAMYDYGGAILTLSDLIVDNCVFENNNAKHNGGAIFLSFTPLGVGFIKNSYFNQNTAEDEGGAISNSGELTIGNCNFVKNKATYGGAVWSKRWLSFSNIGSNFTENEAYYGGAIYAYTFETYAMNLRFKNNRAYSCGGAVMLYELSTAQYTSNFYFKDCIFDSNTCIKKSIFYYGLGGAIYMSIETKAYQPSELRIDGCEFISNSASDHGGAVQIDDENNYILFVGAPSYFISNSAEKYGGAIYTKGIVVFENASVTFTGNNAEGESGGAIYSKEAISFEGSSSIFNGNYAKNDGGAIDCEGIIYFDDCVSFMNNKADRHGGAVYTDYVSSIKNLMFIENYAGEDGGAVYINGKSTVSVESCYFERNKCGDEGGAIYLDSSSSTISLLYNIFVCDLAKSGDEVFNCGKFSTIKHNWWADDLPNFGKDYLIEWHPFGSNEKHYDSDPLKMRITINSTTAGINDSVPVSFSLVSTSGSEVNGVVSGLRIYTLTHSNSGEFSEAVLNKNSVSSYYTPKAIGNHHISVSGWNHPGGSLTVDDSLNMDNIVQILQINYSTFSNLQNIINNAAKGSVIDLDRDYAYFIDDYKMEEKGIEINKNLEIDGHGHTLDAQLASRIFYSSEGTVTLKNLILTRGYQYADDDGGAIYIKSDAKYIIINCTFDSNFALQDGGAIFNDGGELKVTDSTFTHNQASGASFLNDCDGGAIHSKAHLFVDGCVFVSNTAGDNGGAIYATNGLTLGNNPSTFYCNRAYAKGGAICTNKFMEDVKYASFIYNIAGHDNSESYGGGAIYIKNENWITFSQCFFGQNDCTGKGGAINLDSSSSHLTLVNNIFMYNSANHEGQTVFNSGYYDKVNNNWWGNKNPSSNNDQLVEWKFLPWESNVYHTDSSPLRMDLVLNKNYYVINETATATLSFYRPDGSLFTGNIFDAKYDNKYLSFSVSPDISTKNIYYNNNNVIMKLTSPKEGVFMVTFTISTYDKKISLSKSFSVINLSISVPEIKDYFGNGQTLKIHLSGNENLIANQKVSVLFIYNIFEVYTDENGDASLFLNILSLPADKYSVSVTAMQSTVESAVTVLSTINADNIVRVLGDYTPFYASFVDKQGQFLPEYSLVGYSVSSPLIYSNVGKDGVASFNIGFLGVGEHYICLYNLETYEAAVYEITILARYGGIDDVVLVNETYRQNNPISQNYHRNADGGVLSDNNNDFNDSNHHSENSVIKSVVNNHSNNNIYYAVVLLLLICLFGIIIKKYKN